MKTFYLILFCFLGLYTYGQQDTITNPPTNWSMNPKTDSLTMRDYRHLGSRTFTGGATYQWIENAFNQQDLDLVVSNLLTTFSMGDPLAYHVDETVTTPGTPWATDAYASMDQDAQQEARIRSFSAHQFATTMFDTTMTSMVTLFMIERFGVTFSDDARSSYDFYKLVRDSCYARFDQLIKSIGTHTEILRFLNGENNVASNPQENFARELMELYAIGKIITGILDDYGNYMESDVPEVAKICTGYSIIGMRSQTPVIPFTVFTPADHDNTTKNLSAYFGSVSIPAAGINEYDNFVDVMFTQPNAVYDFCTNIYTFFVYDGGTIDGLPDEVYDSIIPVMAQTMIDSNFRIRPVLRQLLKSQHFYDVGLRGGLIKSPVNFIGSIYQPTQSFPSFGFDVNYAINYKIVEHIKDLGMDITAPPSVAGWLAYYQGPSRTKYWVSDLDNHMNLIGSLVGGNGVNVNGNLFKVSFLDFVNNLPNATDPNAVIEGMVLVFLPQDIDSLAKVDLKLLLTNQLEDFEWTWQYGDYLNNMSNPLFADPIRDRIRLVFTTLMSRFDFFTY